MKDRKNSAYFLSEPVFIILEFIDGGTLQDFLRKSRSEHNYR